MITLLLIGIAALSWPAAARAGGTLYVSNLGPNSTPSPLNDSWQYGIDTDGTLFPLDPLSVPNDGLSTSVRVSPDERSAYVISYDGIVQYDIDPETGALVEKDPPVVQGFAPWDLAISPDGKNAYVTHTGPSPAISQFDVDAARGTLSPKNPASVGAGSGSGITVSPDGRSAYSGNYGCTAGSGPCPNGIGQYDVDPLDGTLSPKTPPAVATAHVPSELVLTPDGRHAYGTAAGGILQFDVDPPRGNLTPKQSAGTAERLAVSPDGKSLYGVDYSNAIAQWDVDSQDGTLSPKTPPTVPGGSTLRNAVYNLVLSKDGKNLYAANIDAHTIAQYDVEPQDGTLSPKVPATVEAGFKPSGMATVSIPPDEQPATSPRQTSSQPPPVPKAPPDRITAFASLFIRHRQPIDHLTVRAAMPEPGEITAGGAVRAVKAHWKYRLRSARARVKANVPVQLRLRLSKRVFEKVRAALRRHRRVTARIKISAKDDAGNMASRNRTIVLKS